MLNAYIIKWNFDASRVLILVRGRNVWCDVRQDNWRLYCEHGGTQYHLQFTD